MSLPLSTPSANTGAVRRRHCSSCTCHTTADTPIEPDPTIAASYLDQEIVRLEEVVAQNIRSLVLLKRRRNEGLPVSRVPPEVLSEVFLYFRGDTIAASESYIMRLSWIDILHVSSHWRAVAFATPHLWNTLNLRFPRLVNLFLKHCGALPLSVMISPAESRQSRPAKFPDDLGSIVRCANNPIVDLRLHGIDIEVYACLYDILPHASQGLRLLSVFLRDGPACMDVLDKASLPQLQILHLQHLILKRDSVLLQGCAGSLRELSLAYSDICGGFEALGLLSCLEKLVLDYICSIRSEGIVVMPALRELTLKNQPHPCMRLIQHLSIPSNCHTTIYPRNDYAERHTELMRYISGSAPPPARVHIHIAKSIITIQFGQYTVVLEYSNQQRYYSERDAPSIANAVLSPATSALTLICEENSELTLNDLLSLVHDTSFTDLRIGGRGAFIDPLARCIALHDEFLPSLAQLHITGADFIQLLGETEQCWNHGVAARRGVLVNIRTVGCIGVPPATSIRVDTVTAHHDDSGSAERKRGW